VTTDEDSIVYAQRVGRDGLTRFVKNRAPEPCSLVMMVLKKAREADTYVLLTAFIGPRAEPEPWHPTATEASVVFWNNHALVWDEGEEVVPGTVSPQA
jgi:hypothetical protein